MSVPLFRQALLAALMLCGAWLAAIPALAAEPNAAQRVAFSHAYATARNGGNSWRLLASGLRDYPLYPYLSAAAMQHDIRQLDRTTVEDYLRRYPDWIPTADLRRAFLLELARRKDWSSFTALYQPGLGDALGCDALQAKLARSEPLNFASDLSALWAKPNLPSACDPVLAAARDQGLLTVQRVWDRINRAADANQPSTIAAMAALLPADAAVTARQFELALRDPAAAITAADGWADTTRNTQAAALAVMSLARRQSTSADHAWQNLQGRFRFTQTQRGRIAYTLALFDATDFDADALARLIALPSGAQTDASREWRVRVALARQDWPAVLAAIDAMPPTQQQDGEWRYFRARALAASGREAQARDDYAALATEPTFFGFLAADKLKQPYALCPVTLAPDPQREQNLLANAGLLRAFELYAVNLPDYARREWTRALQGTDQVTQQLAAELANRRGWYDRAVFTLNSGRAWRMYALRFPLVRQDGLVPHAQVAGIEPAWAYGILRAESAWVNDAHSGADARGLMQLVPSTGELVAKRNALPWSGAESLYEPGVNIALGTRYLAHMAARFSGSPWLASAAYDAGPNRVDQWLAARGTLAPDLFIATIPFKETREYVARVMAFTVIYDWRLNGDAVPLTERLSPVGQPYALPTRSTPRTDIRCPKLVPTTRVLHR
ncbi:MAG: transglycosylase SLT domain-containing protein [Rhodanobacter sp.]